MEDLLPIPGNTVYTKAEIEKRGRAIVTGVTTHFTNIKNGRTHATEKSVVWIRLPNNAMNSFHKIATFNINGCSSGIRLSCWVPLLINTILTPCFFSR
jgi:hypothetical protein